MISKDLLPEKICLENYGGNYKAYIDAIYEVFERDFIRHKTCFGLHKLSMKYHPAFQERAYTFYHMTHKGEIESEREPDLRRCECMPWARPTIENTEEWDLKFWRQTRQRSNNRVCIALETESETYFVILEVRESYVLLWTAFLSEYRHQSQKKLKEFEEWKRGEGNGINTPDELIASIQKAIKKARG